MHLVGELLRIVTYQMTLESLGIIARTIIITNLFSYLMVIC